MPSLFSRRQGSESVSSSPKHNSSSQGRRSLDASNREGLKGRQVHDGEASAKKERGRLGSITHLLHRKPETHELTPESTPPPSTSSLLDDPVTPPQTGTRLVGSSPFPQNYSLSGLSSPENNGHSRSGSWQPSYPTVLPDDSYADTGTSPVQGPTSTLPSENAYRRSIEVRNGQITPSPDRLSDIPVMRPDSIPAQSAPPPTTALPTPPDSATSTAPPIPLGHASENSENTATASQPQSSAPSAIQQESSSTRTRTPPSFIQIPLNDEVPVTKIAPSATAASTSQPPSPMATKNREAIQRRQNVISSPPMPQPIRNLPTMVGWPSFMKDGNPATPGWGTLAKEGGPRTPAWTTGATGSRTPGWSMATPGSRPPGTPGAGFPFSLPSTPLNQSKGKDKKNSMTEEELRKARRSMVSNI